MDCSYWKETVIATGSGEDDASELEYVEEEEVSSDSSYHSPIVASEVPLFVFGSPAETPAPILLPLSCACPVPAVIHLEDDVEMTAVPRENNTLIPVQVERPPRYTVGIQRASRGRPLAHYKSSTRRLNRHAKQLGVCHIPSPETFMGQDTRFPSVREFRARVLASGGGADQGISGFAERSFRSSEDPGVATDEGSSCRSPSFSGASMCYRPCSPSCGGNCLGGTTDLY